MTVYVEDIRSLKTVYCLQAMNANETAGVDNAGLGYCLKLKDRKFVNYSVTINHPERKSAIILLRAIYFLKI